jgi:hypothetical protein
VATLRVLRTAKTTLSRVFYLDEVATPATGNVVVSVTREDGTAVQSGNATLLGDGVTYTYVFNGSDLLDRLLVSWALTVGGDAIVLDQDVIEVVGGFYFGLAEARQIDTVFANTTRYPTADVIDVRTQTEYECENICRQAFVPRFERETLDGHPNIRHLRLRWPNLRKVRALSVNGVAWDSARLSAIGADRLGIIRPGVDYWWFQGGGFGSAWPWGVGNIVVEYEHGLDRPDPDIVRGAKIRWKSLMFERKSRSPLPDRSERLQTSEVGTVTIAAESQWSTGIPSVDAAYARHPSPRPDFG